MHLLKAYLLNSSKVQKGRFEEAVRALGIAVSSPFWHIRQNGVQTILGSPPALLHDYLCEVAGTKSINTQRAAALKQVIAWRSALLKITAAVSTAEAASAHEGEQLRLLDRLAELQRHLKQLPAAVAQAKAQLCSAEARVADCDVAQAEAAAAVAAAVHAQANATLKHCAAELAAAQSGQDEHEEEVLQVQH